MDIRIGSRIKELRKKSGLTQEQLADSIGISFQAISKWENNISLPDIIVVPKLAQIFGVTTDEIFSYNLKKVEEEIEGLVYESYKLRESDPKKGKEILEEGLKKYPENDILLNNLLYCMNYRENPDATIKIASKLIDSTSYSDVKYDALRFLAYAYDAKGDSESAVAAIEQIPELYFTKLSELAFVTSGQQKYDAAEKQKWISFETMLQMMGKLAEYYKEEGDCYKAKAEAQNAINMINALDTEEKIERFQIYLDFFMNYLK